MLKEEAFCPAGWSVLLRHSLHYLQPRCRRDCHHVAAADVFAAPDHRHVCDSDGHRYGHRYIRPTRRGTPLEISRTTLTHNSHVLLSRTPSLQNRARRSRAASLKRTPTSSTTTTGRTRRSECRSKLAPSLCPTRPQVTVCNRLVLPSQEALNFTQHFAQHPKETLQILLLTTAAGAAAAAAAGAGAAAAAAASVQISRIFQRRSRMRFALWRRS